LREGSSKTLGAAFAFGFLGFFDSRPWGLFMSAS
jgi:hypothetical protein